jgi:hypothetical protein
MAGTCYVGWHRTTVDEVFSDEAARCIRTFIDATNPVGPGGVDFLSFQGSPVLTDINTGRFNGAHASRLFHAVFAPPGSEYACFKMDQSTGMPPESLTVSLVWDMLRAAGLAFTPGAAGTTGTQGVFPVSFTRGLRLQFVVVAKDFASSERMQAATKALLLDPAPPPPAGWGEAKELDELKEVDDNKMKKDTDKGEIAADDATKGTAATSHENRGGEQKHACEETKLFSRADKQQDMANYMRGQVDVKMDVKMDHAEAAGVVGTIA